LLSHPFFQNAYNIAIAAPTNINNPPDAFIPVPALLGTVLAALVVLLPVAAPVVLAPVALFVPVAVLNSAPVPVLVDDTAVVEAAVLELLISEDCEGEREVLAAAKEEEMVLGEEMENWPE
jgi:hypothetical protein